jgi:hypothetical protein
MFRIMSLSVERTTLHQVAVHCAERQLEKERTS